MLVFKFLLTLNHFLLMKESMANILLLKMKFLKLNPL